MEPTPKRPVILLVTQIVLLLIFVSVLINAAYLAYKFGAELISVGAIAGIGLLVGFGLVPLLAFIGIQTRRTYGRYLTSLFLLFVFFFWARNLVLHLLAFPSFGSYLDSSYGFWMDVSYVVLLALLAVILIPLTFSKNVDAWFRPSVP